MKTKTLSKTDETNAPLLWAAARELARVHGSKPREQLAAAQRLIREALQAQPRRIATAG